MRILKRAIFGALLASAAIMLPALAKAGSGQVNVDGTINITVNFRFPPSSTELEDLQQIVTEASERIWDASEGQLRFGTVTFTAGRENEDLADAWIFPQRGRATAWIGGIDRRGLHTTLYYPSLSASTFAHEFAHLALTLGDEYRENRRFGQCWGQGECIAGSDITPESQCMMQDSNHTEFCTHANHDPIRGDGEPCPSADVDGDGIPDRCDENCAYYNHSTQRYETTQQHAVHGVSCWSQLIRAFPFLVPPAHLPEADPPDGFEEPTFVDNVEATSTVLLVLDRSGSMNWNTQNDWGEVCANGIDDDQDGVIDESDCTEPRLTYLKAAARGFLELSRNQGVRVGIISFDGTASLDAPFQDLTPSNYNGLVQSINGLSANGGTGIGRALSATTLLFGNEPEAAANKTAFLISDGVNTTGETPQSVIPALRRQGIRVFTLSTGEASDDSTLTEIAGETKGSRLDTPDASGLVPALTELWARQRNGNILIPKMPYKVSTRDGWEKEPPKWDKDRSSRDWVQGSDAPSSAELAYERFSLQVPPETDRLLVMLAGNLSDMTSFGMEAILEGPSTTVDTTSPGSNMRVVRDGYFVMLELTNPEPGDWTMAITGQIGAGPIQTGNLSVVAEGGGADLFTSIDNHLVEDYNDKVKFEAISLYNSPLVGTDYVAGVVRLPDGTFSSIALREDTVTPGRFHAELSHMPFEGLYEIRMYMSTGESSYTDPGEELFHTEPIEQFWHSPFQLTGRELFYIKNGKKVTPDHREE